MPSGNPPKPIAVGGELEYKIEGILAHRVEGNTLEYLVRWLGYDEADDTWVSIVDFAHARDLLYDYHRHIHTSTANLLIAGMDYGQ